MKMNIYIHLLVIFVTISLVFYGSSFASDPNELVSLQDYLRYAAMHNAGLQSRFEEFKSTIEEVPQMKALPDPQFTFGYFIEEVETRVGPQEQRYGIMQMFPWFGKIEARTDAAAAAAKAARQRYEAEKLKLFNDVKNGFWEYAYLGRAVELGRQNEELMGHFEEVARARYIAGATPHPDVIRAQIELAILQDKLQTLQEKRRPLTANLNRVLNRQQSLLLPWPKPIVHQTVGIQWDDLVAQLRKANPRLKALDHALDGARSKVVLAEKRSYPDIGIGVDWIRTGEAAMPVHDSGKDSVIAMFSVNIPLWGDSYSAGRRQARADVRQVQAQRVQLENDLVARAVRVLFELEDAERKVNLFNGILIPKAKEMLEVAENAYRTDTVDFLTLIDAQRTLLNFELAYERAVTDHQQRLAELEMLAGKELNPVPLQ
ncbi:MAG: TolC family protein [Sedimentisphaerales bacterium]|nr:TolC family protein [Sedimentisphaerales bacterium]